jgi:hypothetical protein
MNIEIGGYFGLELNNGAVYHPEAIGLNTGRNALEYILRTRNFKKIFLPYYSCDALLEPLKKTNTSYDFYKIDKKLEPKAEKIGLDEAILIVNYFGVLDNAVKKLSYKYAHVVIDNSQAFYSKPIKGIDTFYSNRKFFGVANGAYLYTSKVWDEALPTDISYDRMSHLLIREDINANKGYSQFIINEKLLCNQPIKKMSLLTSHIMKSIDYKKVKKIRRNNFLLLHKYLNQTNELKLKYPVDCVPMVYPYLIKNSAKLKEELIANKIYTATYWSNVFNWVKKDSWEYYLADNLLALPIDQRYSKKEIKYILNLII